MRPYIAWPAGFNVPLSKVTGYLLDPAGGSPAKARWWLAQGFSIARPDELAAALFEHTSAANFVGIRVPQRLWGHRLVFEGPIRTPIAAMPRVRSVWQVAAGTVHGVQGIADLVTAHRI
ncbi:hypothetical protein Q8W71_19705 [Methylobacterium sp. NEAU 140]|uniref:DUF6883 domain-containing protein n=1 Tax=Methylobacterium sp. NEAU 140 TaxID=3064945 RepID=UPI002736BF2D|nr:DUF6883 domain-containing protein [Methylobacterium sp. NEAU 140]MDP4024860.1 hypothetical protein [Methylobacterium sp. NEAU 140]